MFTKKTWYIICAVGMFSILIGAATAQALNGIYVDGTNKTVKSYTNSVLDWGLPLEGTFTTWTGEAKIDTGETSLNPLYDIAVNTNGTIFLLLNADTKIIMDGVVTEYADLVDGHVMSIGYGMSPSSSILDTYRVYQNRTLSELHLEVWKYAAYVDTLSPDVVTQGIYTPEMAMSVDGKYVVVVWDELDDGKIYAQLFVGS